MNQKYLKPVIIFGGGLLLFMLLKPKNRTSLSKSDKASFSDDKVSLEEFDKKGNAQIALKAYSAAIENGESKERLDDLNKELLKEFNMECRIASSGKIIVYDKRGNKILSA